MITRPPLVARWTMVGGGVLAMLAGAARVQADEASGPFGVDVTVGEMVPMRDGVRLATDLYRPVDPASSAGTPVILIRTPYGAGDGRSPDGLFFASHGYSVVIQDTRGRHRSEGTWRWLLDDGPDGVDTADWIAAQPWSNGRIGMMGTSYVGGTQHALAMAGSPHLETVIPVDAVSNMGRQSMRNAGAFELRFWNWIVMNAAQGSTAARDPARAAALEEMAANRLAYLAHLPLRPGTTPLKFAPEYESWLVESMRHGANDAYWRQNAIVDHPEDYPDIPVYLVGGWYDSWAGNTTANYRALAPRLQSNVSLIMGPWIHGQQGESRHGQVSFGPDAAIAEPRTWRLRWFDRWLRDDTSVVGREDPFRSRVRIFVMGTGSGRRGEDGRIDHGGFWRDEDAWPPRRAVPTPFYVHGDGTLGRDPPVVEPGGRDAATSYTFDPRDPVPTIGGCISSGNDIMLQGAWDQRGGPHVWNLREPIPLSARNDVLVFQTEPLEQDVEVTGELEVRLWVSSSAVDTDFTAKLVDVHPPTPDLPGGFDMNVTDGIVRARYRDSLASETFMEPGRVYPVTVLLYPTANVFKKGHRIRVDLSSSNFPRFDVNPNTGEPLARHRRMQTAVNTIHHDRTHPSHILLPVVPHAERGAR